MFDTAIVAAAATAAVPGSLVGLGAGLVPGLHANTMAHALLAYPALAIVPLAGGAGAAVGSPEAMAAAAGFLFGMALGHAFTDDIPAVFLGAPDADTALSVLPGHRLLSAGMGEAAVRAAAHGSLLGVVFCMPFVPVLAWLMGPPNYGYESLRPFFPAILLGLAGILVAAERGSAGTRGVSGWRARALAVGLLLSSAALGELVMFRGMPDWGFYPLGHLPVPAGGPLLALFAGLFGIPTLLLAAIGPRAAPPDAPRARRADPLDKEATVRYASMGTGAGALVGWLPGIGAAQATTLAFVITDFFGIRPAHGRRPGADAASFMVAAAAVGTANLVFNLVALSLLQRERSGVMVALSEVAGPVVTDAATGAGRADLLVGILAGAVACLPLCYFAAVHAGRFAAWAYRKGNPQRLARASLFGLFLGILVLEGATGLGVAVVATCIGLVPPSAGVKRVHLMGCVLVPVSIRIAGL